VGPSNELLTFDRFLNYPDSMRYAFSSSGDQNPDP
jgi:hypothetical protein